MRNFLRCASLATALATGCGGRVGPPSDAASDSVTADGDATVANDAADGGCPGSAPAMQFDSPLAYGAAQLRASQTAASDTTQTQLLTADDPAAATYLADPTVVLAASPESFVIVPSAIGLVVIGRDATGAMYGALELAERLDAGASIAGYAAHESPAVAVRGANVFMTLPDAGETCWWFRDASYWTSYLDLLARARINQLDLHGMYNLANTVFPNALLYLATSSTYPDLGAPADDRAANLAMVQTIVAMAHARGIRVELMTYRSDLDLTGDGPDSSNDPRLPTYIREATHDLVTRVPDLYGVGFRIGESTHDASWYSDTFIAGALSASSTVQISTRTWLTSKPEVLALSSAASGRLLVEAKYNGEQLGPPYIVEGGAPQSQGWRSSYFYEDYLQSPTPYTFIFQIWASGTHRFFSHASYTRIQRIAQTLSFSPHVAGFTLQPSHAYLPQRDFYHHDPADSFSPWTFTRDDLEYLLFGRLAYDPTTPESVFRDVLRERTGTDGLWDALQAASEIVPWIQTANTCGADSRNVAVELEWIGTLEYWASPATAPQGTGFCGNYHGPFDSFSIASPDETARDLVNSSATSRLTPQEIASRILDAALIAKGASAMVGSSNPRARDVARVCVALADLGMYVAHKLRGASALAVYERTGSATYLAVARTEVQIADAAWSALADDTSYVQPFDERLRMQPLGYIPFHWRDELAAIDANDAQSVDAVATRVAANPPMFTGTLPDPNAWLSARRSAGPGLGSIAIAPPDPSAASWTVTVSLGTAPPAGAQVNVLWKPFASASDWTSVPASGSGTSYSATINGTGAGAMFAVEIVGAPGDGWRYPDALQATPYVVLAPL